MQRPIIHHVNKAKIVIYPIKNIRSIEINAMVNLGGWYESPQDFGVSHFLEHMLFQGTRKFPTSETISGFTKENGIYTNAYTNGKNINFYLNLPDINLDKGLKILEEMIFYPTFPQQVMSNESNVVIQELKSFWDKPETRFYHQTDQILFGAHHPYTRDVLGTPENIQKFNHQHLLDIHQKYFQPQNLTIFVVGHISPNNLIEKLSQILNHQNTYKSKLNLPTIQPREPSTLIYNDKPEQETICLNWILDKSKKFNHRLKRISNNMFSRTLGSGMDSLLFKIFRLKYGLVYNIRSSITNYDNCSVFEISSQIDPSNSQKFFQIFDSEFESILNNLTEEMFNKTINYTNYQSLMTYDSVSEISQMIVNETLKNKDIFLPEDYIELSKKINFHQTLDFFKQKLTRTNRYTFRMTPIKPEN